MGQALDDLPDPTDQAATGPGADDLLAQMAGEEIDRLLADESLTGEAIAGSPPAANAPAGVIIPSTVPEDDPETAMQLDALFAELVAVEPPVPASVPRPAPRPAGPATPAVEAVDTLLSQQLDDLFAQLQSEESAAAPAAAPAQSVPAPAAPAVAAATAMAASTDAAQTPADASVDPAEQTSALERQVLSSELLDAADETPAAIARGAAAPTEAPSEPRVPLYLRLLELINAPLANASESIRDLIGKAAIMNLVLALVILVYVLFVRGA